MKETALAWARRMSRLTPSGYIDGEMLAAMKRPGIVPSVKDALLQDGRMLARDRKRALGKDRE